MNYAMYTFCALGSARFMLNRLESPRKSADPHPNPAFESRIVHGDVIDTLAKQPRELKFDVVIADPPYNVGKDFGANMPANAYVAWSKQWLGQCFELLADDAIIYVYGFPEVLARVAATYPIDEQRWLAWHYTNKTVPSSKFWQRSHESVLCLWKPGNKRPNLEVNQIREPYTKTYLNGSAGKARKGTKSRFGKDKVTAYTAHQDGALPRDVIKVPALAGGAGAVERWFMCEDCNRKVFLPSDLKDHRGHSTIKHPTQKPLELTRRLIQSRINGTGGRVLVPFAGSGSECVAADSLGVEYLGIEINPVFVDLAQKWLKCRCTA